MCVTWSRCEVIAKCEAVLTLLEHFCSITLWQFCKVWPVCRVCEICLESAPGEVIRYYQNQSQPERNPGHVRYFFLHITFGLKSRIGYSNRVLPDITRANSVVILLFLYFWCRPCILNIILNIFPEYNSISSWLITFYSNQTRMDRIDSSSCWWRSNFFQVEFWSGSDIPDFLKHSLEPSGWTKITSHTGCTWTASTNLGGW